MPGGSIWLQPKVQIMQAKGKKELDLGRTDRLLSCIDYGIAVLCAVGKRATMCAVSAGSMNCTHLPGSSKLAAHAGVHQQLHWRQARPASTTTYIGGRQDLRRPAITLEANTTHSHQHVYWRNT
eukprot:1159038-Pelagomonas_calceolata.AAC.6